MDALVYQVSKITLAQIIKEALVSIERDDLRQAEGHLADAVAVVQRMQQQEEGARVPA